MVQRLTPNRHVTSARQERYLRNVEVSREQAEDGCIRAPLEIRVLEEEATELASRAGKNLCKTGASRQSRFHFLQCFDSVSQQKCANKKKVLFAF